MPSASRMKTQAGGVHLPGREKKLSHRLWELCGWAGLWMVLVTSCHAWGLGANLPGFLGVCQQVKKT